jgi:eukaryotic-like serine/threonine-protein kinase
MTSPIAKGDEIYKYEFEENVGGGNFGEVWLAKDKSVNRRVAIKVLSEDMYAVAERLEEARRGNRLAHKNVVRVEYADVAEHGGAKLVLIAMEYHAKGSVRTLFNPENFVAAPLAVKVVTEVLEGLEYLHDQGILHNDIKPSNILLSSTSEALLTDYGISCELSGNASAVATSAYVPHRAPETAASRTVSVRSDVYQVGLTLFRLLNGEHVLRDCRRTLGAKEFERLKSCGKIPLAEHFAPHLDPRLKRVIRKATAADPRDRYSSALEMRRALERIRVDGYWDVDSNGQMFGVSGTYVYTFSISNEAQGESITAWKEHAATGRKSRVLAHCHRNLTPLQRDLAIRELMASVVRGEM